MACGPAGSTRATSRVSAKRRIPPKGCANAAGLTGTRSGAVDSSRRCVVRRAFQGSCRPIAIRQPTGVAVDMPKGHEPMAETTARRPSVLVFRLELRITTANCADRARAADRARRRPALGARRALGDLPRGRVSIARRPVRWTRAWHGMERRAVEICLPQLLELWRHLELPGKLGAEPWRTSVRGLPGLRAGPHALQGHHVRCRAGHGRGSRDRWNVRLSGRYHACSSIERAGRLDRVADSLVIE